MLLQKKVNVKDYLNTLFSKPSTNKTFLPIITRVAILEDIAISTVELALFVERKERLFTIIYTPNLTSVFPQQFNKCFLTTAQQAIMQQL